MDALVMETRDRVRFITMNRPDRHNAFDDALIKEMTEAFDAAAVDTEVRAVVLQAAGKSFSAGADLNWMKRMAEYDHAQNLADAKALAALMHAIDTCPKPVLGVVQGAAYGGGVGLVACCDIAIASAEAKFCLSEVKLGLIPAVISPYVVRAMGYRAARRYFLTAEVFGAAKAESLGLVHEAVPAAQLGELRDGLLKAITANGPAAMAAAKELARRAGEDALDEPLRHWTASRIAEIRASGEGREGVRAFLEKRKPAWLEE